MGFISQLVGELLVNSIHQAGLSGVITRLRNPLELRFVIHQNPGLQSAYTDIPPTNLEMILNY